MKSFYLTLAAGAAVLVLSGAGVPAASASVEPAGAAAQSTILIQSGDIAAAPRLFGADGRTGLFEKAQWFWGGRNYCWYDFGWSGPGWYRCGYARRRGFGWGGPVGWHGWDRGRGGYRGGFHDRGFRGGQVQRGEFHHGGGFQRGGHGDHGGGHHH